MVVVLKIGHRIHRDYRLDTHLALAARAFCASGFYYSGQKDSNFEESIRKVVAKFGGDFRVEYAENYSRFIRDYTGKKVHLTVYGQEVSKIIGKIQKFDNILIVVGGEKMPPDIYNMVDFNVSITNQPHSEVSATAIFLNRYFEGKEFKNMFDSALIKVLPSKRGKKVFKKER